MKRCTITVFLTIVLVLNIGLSIGFAKEGDVNPWAIDSYSAVVEIGPDGSMEVEEYIGYSFKKDFSGLLVRTMDTSAASGVDDFNLYAIEDIDGEDITQSRLTPLESGTYEILLDEEYGIVEGVNISLEPGTQKKYLVYKYKLNDLIGIYSDMALLDWTFLHKDEKFSKKEMSISIKIPGKGNGDAIHTVLEGPIYTELNIDGNLVKYKGRLMDKDRDLKLVMLMPTSWIPEGRKMIDNDIAGKVQDWISQYEDEIETKQNQYGTHKLVRDIMSYLGLGVLIISFLYIFFKYGRRPKVEVDDIDFGELPADYYTPGELGVLMNRGRVKPNYLVATLIDLYNRGYLYIEEAGDEGYALSIDKTLSTKDLKGHEEYLLAWVFGDIGHGTTRVTTEEIHRWNNDNDNKKRNRHKYKTWTSLVVKRTERWKFYEDLGKARLIGLLSGIIALIPGIILLGYNEILWGILIIGLAILLAIYSRLIFKPTEFGAINMEKWGIFKAQLKEISNTETPLIKDADYEKILGYSIVLNRWKDFLAYLENLYNSGEIGDDQGVLIHRDNLDKTHNIISSMAGDKMVLKYSKDRGNQNFRKGAGISR